MTTTVITAVSDKALLNLGSDPTAPVSSLKKRLKSRMNESLFCGAKIIDLPLNYTITHSFTNKVKKEIKVGE